MLTLFQPWRSGKDLKQEDYSWDETFNNHKFTDHQSQLIKNFNIRYECNNARDDYSAQLKKKNLRDGAFPWLNADILGEINEHAHFEGADFGDKASDNENHNGNKYTKLGNFGKTSLVEMEATRIGVTEAGWLDDSPNGLTTVDTVPLQPQVIQKGSRWKATVEEEKQKILADRSKNIPTKSLKMMSDSKENNVKIIDQSYLQRKFKAKIVADNKLIDDTVQEFFLNTKQERAFIIIANHAVEPKSDQLKMYLGGMGGTGKSQVIKALMHFFNQRNESHHIVVLGPTGSSAALINGSTYHSFLGINLGQNSANKINTFPCPTDSSELHWTSLEFHWKSTELPLEFNLSQ